MDFSDPHFAEPLRLWLLVPAALALAALWYRAARARARAVASLAAPAMIRGLLAAHSPRRRAFKYALFAVAAVLVVAALARPRWGREKGDRAEETEDVVFLLDTSRSMTARDVPPDRLTSAKRAIATFVSLHPSGRVGLVAFAGKAFLQCPPTADRDIFNETLAEMDTDVITLPGTDIGGAIDAGYAAFGDKKTEGRRTLVLLTDGEDLSGAGVETATKLAREGVVIHAVGIGGSGYEIPAHADGSGGTVMTNLDEKTLRDIARATGGEYFRLGAGNAGFGAIETKLGKIATRSDGASRAVERFSVPLALAALLLAAESLIGTRRKDAPSGAGPVLAAALLFALFAHPSTARAETPEELYNKGADALRRGDYTEAEGFLKMSLEDAGDALRPAALRNLGQARARAATKAVDKHLAKDSPAAALPKTEKHLGNALADVEDVLARHAKGDFDPQDAAEIYSRSLGTRKTSLKQLKSAREAIGDGETTARKLTRAADDFAGARELDPSASDAQKDADATADYTRRFDRTLENEKKTADNAVKLAADLKAKLEILRKLLKLDPNSGHGEGDDDDAEPKPANGARDGRSESERRAQEGKEGRLNREEALAALEQMRRDLRNRVPSNFGNPDKDAGTPREQNAGDR